MNYSAGRFRWFVVVVVIPSAIFIMISVAIIVIALLVFLSGHDALLATPKSGVLWVYLQNLFACPFAIRFK